jgi:hypothetical protein
LALLIADAISAMQASGRPASVDAPRARRAATLVAFVGACLFGGTRCDAQEADVPVAIQIPLFLKVITFDRQLQARAGSELLVAVAYQSGNRASTITKDEAVRALANVSGLLDGRSVSALVIDLDRESLGDVLARHRIAVLYIAPLRAVDLAAVAAAARAARVTTMTGVPRYVPLGITVSVRLQGDRPRLLINVESARLEGADFSAELLKLAQVTR